MTEGLNDSRPRASIKDVASAVGVHVSTVSRALRRDPEYRISPETIERIETAAQQLGYRPDPVAAGMRTKRTGVIGALVPRLSDPVLATVYESIETTASEFGYQALVSTTHDDPRIRAQKLALLRDRRVDGVIVADIRRQSGDLRALERCGIPFVLVSRRSGDAPAVTGDDYRGGYLAGQHLAAMGHTRVAIIGGPAFASTAWGRVAGCQAALRDAGISVPKAYTVRTTFDAIGGVEATRKLLALRDRPTALFAGDDYVAIGAMGAMQQHGLLPGRDLAIVGFNDISVSASLPVPLTTVRSDLVEMGAGAIRSLLKVMGGEDALNIRIPTELVVRSSSKGQASESPLVCVDRAR